MPAAWQVCPGCRRSLRLRTELFQQRCDTNTNEPRGGRDNDRTKIERAAEREFERKKTWKPEKANQQRQRKIDEIGEWRSVGSVYLKVFYVPHINIKESIRCDVTDILFTNDQPALHVPSKLSMTQTWPHIQTFLSISILGRAGPKLLRVGAIDWRLWHHEKITGGSMNSSECVLLFTG